jgi:hypothetical protein
VTVESTDALVYQVRGIDPFDQIRALEDELDKLRTLDTHQRIAELEEALMLATGPTCSSCGQAIDPDWCHCGGQNCNPQSDGHSFVPAGCICGYHDQDWPRIANGLRVQLWRARSRMTMADRLASAATEAASVLRINGLGATAAVLDEHVADFRKETT